MFKVFGGNIAISLEAICHMGDDKKTERIKWNCELLLLKNLDKMGDR